MKLRLAIKGASAEDMQRGIEAAEKVFATAGISAEQGAGGMFALEGWDVASFRKDMQPTEDEDYAASVWMEANKAAIAACCPSWPADEVPRHLLLELVEG
jgi:hypothetical protein